MGLQLSAAQPPTGVISAADHAYEDDLGVDLTATPAAADVITFFSPGGTPRTAAPDAPLFSNPLELLSDEEEGTGNAASDAFGLDLSPSFIKIGVRPGGAFGAPKQNPCERAGRGAAEPGPDGASTAARFGAEQYTSTSEGCCNLTRSPPFLL